MSAPQETTNATSRKSRIEREAKLQAPADFKLPEQGSLTDSVSCGVAAEQQLETVYYDTSDLRLAKHDASLRFRKDEGWTLKLPLEARGQTLVRTEHTFDSEGDAVPPEALDLVQAMTRHEPLAPVAQLRTLRRHVPLLDAAGSALGEMVYDAVSVMEDDRPTATFHEIEVELAEDAPDGILDRVVQVIVQQGAVVHPVQSKLLRALGPRAAELGEAAAPEPGAKASVAELVRCALAKSVQQLVRHDPGIRVAADSEQVHQARVATRRLRSDLRAFRRFLEEEWASSLRDELSWLGGALGAVRDAEVLLRRLNSRAEALPAEDRPLAGHLLSRLEEELEHKRAELLVILRSDRYLSLLDRLEDTAKQPAFTELAHEAKRSALVRLVRKPWRRLRAAVKALPAQPRDADLHAVRIQAKRCRYTADAATPVGGRAAGTFAAACRQIQDVLGEHQDAVVAQGWLREAAVRASSSEAYASGELAGEEQRAASLARAAWPKAWKRLDRKARRRWMNA
ncbi:MAG TPA: CYTH and CHAD domain-containing protein [Chloroflexota bacterium]